MCIETNNIPTRYTINGCGAPHYYAHTHASICDDHCVSSHMNGVGFFNYSNYLKQCYGGKIPKVCTIEDVLNSFPCGFKKCGMVVTFFVKNGNWESWQYIGSNVTHWCNMKFWKFLYSTESVSDLVRRVDYLE